jgi:DNA repair protein RAD50
MEESAKSLREIQEQITNTCKHLESMTKNNNIDQMRQELATKKTNSTNLQQSLDKVDEDLNFLNSISSITKEMEFKKASLATKEAEFKRVKNKNADNLKRVFASQPIESNYKQNVQNMYEKLHKEISDINKSIQSNQVIVTECQTMRKSQRDQVAKYEKELAEAEEKVYDALTGSPYEEIVEKMKEKIAKLQLDFGAFKASEVLYKR